MTRVGALLGALVLAGCGASPKLDAAEPAGAPPPGPDAGAAAIPELDVAVVGSAAQVRPEEIAAGGDRAVLVAARNEFESFQVAVNATGQALTNLTVELAGPLAGPDGASIDSSFVTIHRVGYYTVQTPSDLEGAPGRWPDPLIPAIDRLVGEARDAFPVDVPLGENRVAWIDLQVPREAIPGRYHGALELRADGFESRVPIELTVLAFTLPSTASLKSAFGLSHDTCHALGLEGCSSDPAQNLRARQLFARAALDNRITLAHPQARRISPRDPGSAEEFREWFLPLIEGTAETRLPGAQLTTFQVNLHSDRAIAGWRDEIRQQGFVDRSFVWSCDEPHFFPVFGDPAGNWPPCIERLRNDHAAWPEVSKLVTAHIQTAEEHGAADLIDILVVNVEYLDGPEGTPYYVGNQRPKYDAFLAEASRPKEVWLYAACGSHGCSRNDHEYTRGWAGGYAIDAPASQSRAVPWLAFAYGLTGTLYYDTVLQLATAWDDQYRYTGNGEGTLFYPGTPDRIGGRTIIPIESLRLKYLRDGMEDFEYLAFLRERGHGDEARRIARELFPAAWDTTRSDSELQQARRELAARVAELTGGPRP